MHLIKLLGPQSKKYEMLKSRIMSLIELCDEGIQLIETKDLNDIVEADIDVVPVAIFEGEVRYLWTEQTSLDDMLAQIKINQEDRDPACRCGEGCKMRKIDPK